MVNRKALTGIDGLDNVLGGGLPENRLYLVQGEPGVGKTTLALQFLMEGVRQGENVLYISLSETKEELESVASSHGWDLANVELFELSALEHLLTPDNQQTVYHPAEVELTEATRALMDAVERVNPSRVVIDSLSELRLLAKEPLRYRRQILALKQYLSGRKSTVLLLDDTTSNPSDLQLQSIAHGVILLEQVANDYGTDRRRLRIQKLRGVRFRSGYHDYIIEKGGINAFPRLIAAEHRSSFEGDCLSSGVAGLDELLGGGLDKGASVLLLGPAGAGKSTVGVQFAVAAAERGERAAIYSFEESPRTLYQRSEALGQDVETHIKSGRIRFQQIDPTELTPGEFSHLVSTEVEKNGTKVIVIDSLNGYLNAMPEERFLILHLHELLTYLSQKEVTTLLMVAQHGMLGAAPNAPIDVSYLADTVLLFRFFEHAGRIRQALSVVKRRAGAHEKAIRELTLRKGAGVTLGRSLDGFRGILTGVPVYEGEPAGMAQDAQH